MDKLSLFELFEHFGLEHCLNDKVYEDEKLTEIFEAPIELHIQPTYPLKGGVYQGFIKDGKPVLAATEATEYGSKSAWSDVNRPDEF